MISRRLIQNAHLVTEAYLNPEMSSDQAESQSGHAKKINILELLKKSFSKDSKNPIESRVSENLKTPLQDMINGVLELSTKIARDTMIPRVDIVAVESDKQLKPIVKVACDAGHSRLPVYKDTIDNVIGILYVKDLLRLITDTSRKKFNLKKILREPYFIPETMPLYELLKEFKLRKFHIALVVDEYGGIAGLVTLEDILEEIVGDINDEFDTTGMPEIVKISSNSFEVDSRMMIHDFNEAIGTGIGSSDFDTIGGYVLDLFGRIPKKGESMTDGTLNYRIKSIKGTVINRIVVTIPREK